MPIGAFAGMEYILWYNWYKGIHGIFVNPTKDDAATWIVYQFSPNTNLYNIIQFYHVWVFLDDQKRLYQSFIIKNRVKSVFFGDVIISVIWLLIILLNKSTCSISYGYPISTSFMATSSDYYWKIVKDIAL